uniref:Alternative protein GPR39 n=1 Tax=Homo sapiens TaxID=9606 RepID=L8E9W9_HUMAN|nr:alternative protein GPR39 [Homo sapiens]
MWTGALKCRQLERKRSAARRSAPSAKRGRGGAPGAAVSLPASQEFRTFFLRPLPASPQPHTLPNLNTQAPPGPLLGWAAPASFHEST